MWTNFVDDVFVINLPQRTERLRHAEAQLSKYNIKARVWEAVMNTNGRQGLKYTMIDLFRHCIERKYERVCVLEDDFKILTEDFNELTGKCISQLPQYFDLFYFGGNLWRRPAKYSDNLIVSTGIYSTHAVIYSRKAMEFILQQLHSNAPYDAILVNTIQYYGRCFCAYPLLISQIDGYSDIEKKVISWEKYIEKRYAERTNGLMQ